MHWKYENRYFPILTSITISKWHFGMGDGYIIF